MSINYSRRPAWLVGIGALLVFGLILAACGGAATPAVETAAPTEEAADSAPPAEVTSVVEEEPEPTNIPEEEVATEVEPESEKSGESKTAAACLPADPNTDPIAGAILFLDEYIDTGQVNEDVSPVTDADWAKGPTDAAITMIEYGDYQ